jgi:hypothetical protein
VLRYVLDEKEFLSPFGIRSLSRYHRSTLRVPVERHEHRVDYEPAESTAAVRRQLQLARPDLVPGQRALVRGAAQLYAFYGTTSPSNARPARACR